MTAPVLPPVGPDLRIWGKNLTAYIRRTADKLRFKKTGDRPSEDGVILWDAENGYPVVSLGGEFRQIVIANGYAQLSQDADITAPAADTAYSILYDTPSFADGVSLDDTNPERIVFEEGGIFLLAFTAQISSTSGSTVTFRFWPRINGVNIGGSTILARLHQNDASTVVSRDSLFQVSAGDYLEVMWATDSTDGYIHAFPGTAYAPSSPATTLSVARIRA